MQVVFSRSERGDLSGKVTWSSEEEELSRKKIVFVAGYKIEKLHDWRGALPQDGEEWECDLVRDTCPENYKKGAYVVHLVRKLYPITTVRAVGQSVLGIQRQVQVIVYGNREIITSDYRADNLEVRALRKAFISQCELLAPAVMDAVRKSKTHDVTVLGVDITGVYIEENVVYYRVDNIKVRVPVYKVYEELVRGNRVTNIKRLAERLGIPYLDGDVATFATPVGDIKLICDVSAYCEDSKIEIAGVTTDKLRRRFVTVVTTPWGLRLILEHDADKLCEMPISEAARTAAIYLLSQL